MSGAASPPPAPPGANDPRVLLEEVLARPEFHRGEPTSPPWLERFLDALFGAAGSVPDWVGQAMTAVILLTALLFIVHLLREGGVFRTKARTAAPPGGEASVPDVASDELYHAGRRAADAGRLSEALVLLFRAMVARLAERGLLLRDPSRTNREHLRDLRARPAEAGALRSVLPAFERVRYGENEAGAEDVAAAVSAAAGLFPEEAA